MLDPRRRPELLTPAEMAEVDRFTIAAGTPGIVLMERAGQAVAREAARLAPSRGRIAILCGPGGNGGDGFIAARLLQSWGYPVALALLGDCARLSGEPALAAERWTGLVHPGEGFAFDDAALVIDALYGAGLARDVAGAALSLVEAINAFAASGRPVLSVDVPSGVDGATGQVRGAAVTATASVTFFRLKPGHLLQPGGTLCGRIALADIGLDEGALEVIAPQAFVNAPAIWRDALPRLDASAHKYTRGAALIVSGPAHRTGAARLAARAALRVGAGLATIASPLDAAAINAAHETAVMVAPFSGLAGFAELLADPRRNAVLIGPGAGVGEATRGLVAAALTGASAAAARGRARRRRADQLRRRRRRSGGLDRPRGPGDDRHAARRRVRALVPRQLRSA